MSDENIHYAYPYGKPDASQGKKVMEIVPSDEFFQAWKASGAPYFGKEDSNPEFLEKFRKDYAVEGAQLPIPELDIDIENGRPSLQFTNGMHRLTNLALMGVESIPAIVRSGDHEAVESLPWIRPLSHANRLKLDSEDDPYRSAFPDAEGQRLAHKRRLKEWVEANREQVVQSFRQQIPVLLAGIKGAWAKLSDEEKDALAEKITDFYRDNARVPVQRELQKMLSELEQEQRRKPPEREHRRFVSPHEARKIEVAAKLDELYAPIPDADPKTLTGRQREVLVDKIVDVQERTSKLPDAGKLKELFTEAQKVTVSLSRGLGGGGRGAGGR